MLAALYALCITARRQNVPPLVLCPHTVIFEAHFPLPKLPNGKAYNAEMMYLALDESGRFAYAYDDRRWNLRTGAMRRFDLYQVSLKGHTFLFPTAMPSAGYDWSEFKNWKAFGMHPDKVEAGPTYGEVTPIDPNRFLYSYSGNHDIGAGFALVDLDNPAKGTVFQWRQSYPETHQVPSNIVWDQVSQKWIAYEYADNSVEVGGLQGKPVANIRCVGARVPNLPDALDWRRRRGYAVVSQGGGAAILFVFHLDGTKITLGTVPTNLNLPRGRYPVRLLPSGRILLAMSPTYLSDRSHRHWRKICDSTLWGASADGRYILVGSQQWVGKHWVVRLDE